MSPASSTPRIVVVGCGYWGRNLVRNFHALGALATVVDATPAGRKLAAELAPGVEVVDALEPLLTRPDLHAFALATPAVTHAPLGLKVLAAGRDLFVEKPMALTVADGRALVELAERNGRILQVGHVLEYHPAVPILRHWIASGKLGRLRRLHSHRLNFGKVRTEEDALWNVAPHDFAVMLRITGWMPTQVSCFASHSLGTPRADFAIAMLRFPGEIDAHVFAGWLHPTKEQRLVAVGDRGTAVFDDAAPLAQKLTFYDQHVDFKDGQPELFKGTAQPEPLPPDEPLRLECAAFLESVISRRAPLSDGRSGLRVLAVLEACRRSTESGGKIESVLAL
jgi:predicted dehydrogenase